MGRNYLLLSVIAFALLVGHIADAKTVFRRTDRYRENFKKLDLPQDEIDPNVAPEPQKIQTISPADVSIVSTATAAAPAVPVTIDEPADVVPEVVEEAVSAAATVAPNVSDLVDDTANEVVDAAVAPVTTAAPVAADATPVKEDNNPISKYCKCTEDSCDCCREIGLPLLPVRGPGCAKLSYLGKDKMSVSLKYGDITLATRTISSKRARPICIGLPGGFSEFCGRVYGLSKGKEDFKACLGFELRSDDEVEAALRVSCFKFGPGGLRVADAEPLPSEVNKDEDDDDDIFGFAGGDEEDDYDEDDEDDADDEPDEEDDADDTEDADDIEDDDVEAPEDADYGGFSLAGLLDELEDDDDEKPAAAVAAAATPVAAITPPAIEEIRTVEQKDVVESKDDKGTEVMTEEGSGQSAAAEGATAAVAPTTIKSKKAKKSKKNKKKKAADAEGDLAFEILNGILDFFN